MSTEQPFEPHSDYETCQECDGAGEIIDCCDDLCIGQGYCIHGDTRICPACKGSGEAQ